jgi:shikimate 5-dehydrogenase
MRVVVLGTGGAARAAVAALGEAKSVTLVSRSRAPGRLDWARPVEVVRPEDGALGEAELLINATPVGMSPNVDESPVGGPYGAGVVFDMIYNPERTRLLAEASAAGRTVISGKAMFLAQAARQFEIWTGQAASAAVFSGAA